MITSDKSSKRQAWGIIGTPSPGPLHLNLDLERRVQGMKILWIICVLLLLIMGCLDTRNVRPISPNRFFQGISAKNMIMNVPDNFDLNVTMIVGVMNYRFPRGNYEPLVEDDKGVFFKSPERLTRVKVTKLDSMGTNMGIVDGGIFIDQTKSKGFLWIYNPFNGEAIVFPEEIPAEHFKLEPKK